METELNPSEWQRTDITIVKPELKVLAATTISDNELRTESIKGILDEGPCYLDNQSDGEVLAEYAGRECYQSFGNPSGRTNGQYIANIIKQRHFSVLEHASITVRLSGVSRSFTHEAIRHRHLSPSQLSQRYVDSKEAPFVCPPLFLSDVELFLAWEKSVARARRDLIDLEELAARRHPGLKRKEIREAVRSVAPNATETKIVLTGNLRAWREFLEKRWTKAAEAEIRQVAGMLADELKVRYPYTFGDIEFDGGEDAARAPNQ